MMKKFWLYSLLIHFISCITIRADLAYDDYGRIQSRPSKQALIKSMYSSGTVTNGWDIVYNMGLDSINRALQHQFEDRKNNTEYKNTINITTSYHEENLYNETIHVYLEYGNPLLTFQQNDPNTVTLKMQIENGSLIKCVKLETNPVKCVHKDINNSKTLTAYVPLSKVSGITEGHNILDVKINMAKGAFEVENIGMSDEENIAFSKEIKAHFVQNQVEYLINRLDVTRNPIIDALKPKNFRFKVLKTPANVDILQLFIQIGNRSLLSETQTFLNNLPEPLPVGYEVSLIIRSGLFFSEVLPASLDHSSGWNLIGEICNTSNKTKWRTKLAKATIETKIDIGNVVDHSALTNSRYVLLENPVIWDFSNGYLEAQANGQILLSASHKKQIPCLEKTITAGSISSNTRHFTTETEINVRVVFSWVLNENNILTQSIGIDKSEVGCTVIGHLSSGGWFGSYNPEARINQEIKKQAPSQITSNFKISFTPISVFAVKNLIFPKSNYINLENAAVPGDLLVLGNFPYLK